MYTESLLKDRIFYYHNRKINHVASGWLRKILCQKTILLVSKHRFVWFSFLQLIGFIYCLRMHPCMNDQRQNWVLLGFHKYTFSALLSYKIITPTAISDLFEDFRAKRILVLFIEKCPQTVLAAVDIWFFILEVTTCLRPGAFRIGSQISITNEYFSKDSKTLQAEKSE